MQAMLLLAIGLWRLCLSALCEKQHGDISCVNRSEYSHSFGSTFPSRVPTCIALEYPLSVAVQRSSNGRNKPGVYSPLCLPRLRYTPIGGRATEARLVATLLSNSQSSAISAQIWRTNGSLWAAPAIKDEMDALMSPPGVLQRAWTALVGTMSYTCTADDITRSAYPYTGRQVYRIYYIYLHADILIILDLQPFGSIPKHLFFYT